MEIVDRAWTYISRTVWSKTFMKSMADEEWLQPAAGYLVSDLSSARPSGSFRNQEWPKRRLDGGTGKGVAEAVRDTAAASRIPVYRVPPDVHVRPPPPPPRRCPRRRRRRAGAGGSGGGPGRWERGTGEWANGHLRYELAMGGWRPSMYLWTAQDQMGRDLTVHVTPVQVQCHGQQMKLFLTTSFCFLDDTNTFLPHLVSFFRIRERELSLAWLFDPLETNVKSLH